MVKPASEEGQKVTSIEGQENIRTRECREQDRPILRDWEDHRPANHDNIGFFHQLCPQRWPDHAARRSSPRQVPACFRFDIPARLQLPSVEMRDIENHSRSAAGGIHRRDKDAGVEKKPHRLSCESNLRISAPSRSSSAIHPAICSSEKMRGSGSGPPRAPRRLSKNTTSSCCSSGVSPSAAVSISASVLMAGTLPSPPCLPQAAA